MSAIKRYLEEIMEELDECIDRGLGPWESIRYAASNLNTSEDEVKLVFREYWLPSREDDTDD